MSNKLIGISLLLSLFTVVVIVFLFMSCKEKKGNRVITVNNLTPDSVGNILITPPLCDTIYIHDIIELVNNKINDKV